MRKKWSSSDIKFLINNYKSMNNDELAKHFNISKKAIEAKLHKLGLRRRKKRELQKKRSIKLKIPMSKNRKEAIKILDKGIKLYYENQKSKAMNEFKKILKNFPEEIDIVRKAKEFLE